ncbi:3-oxoacyl-[acyl-carrier-protein] reductase [bacterium]|nr:3-oxoacyl-[acyl-carrier-protein] reductase [Actinomycetota bacterium]MBE33121.1 3-oxoacyl-[acyl-carrier-protein] reductase [bacterium]|tara:strand:- start:2971 stop:3714 length:744 start_codon:yes stop_codon:yes gene_type:complete
MRLKNKNILITGSTRGIGLSIAHECAKEGANLVIHGTKPEKVNEIVDQLKKIYPTKIVGFAYNIKEFENCQNLVKQSLESLNSLDVLINNAGITKDNLLLRMSEEEWSDVIQTNLTSVFSMTKAISKSFLKQKSGKIINMSSVVGIIGNAGQANYAAAKGGINTFTKTIAKEFGAKGIQCNAIAPGFIKTEMIDTLPEEYLNTIIKSIPAKKLGSTDDVSKLVLFLASNESDYITGQIISVDGGMNI